MDSVIFFCKMYKIYNEIDKNPPTIEEVDTIGTFDLYTRKKDSTVEVAIKEEKIIIDFKKNVYN